VYEAAIPNREVFKEWGRVIGYLFDNVAAISNHGILGRILKAFSSFRVQGIRDEFAALARKLSQRVAHKEHAYQLVVAGVLFVVGDSPQWRVDCEIGAVHGFADLIVANDTEKLTLVFEFKKAEKRTQERGYSSLVLDSELVIAPSNSFVV
jgi:hypothetical protein